MIKRSKTVKNNIPLQNQQSTLLIQNTLNQHIKTKFTLISKINVNRIDE